MTNNQPKLVAQIGHDAIDMQVTFQEVCGISVEIDKCIAMVIEREQTAQLHAIACGMNELLKLAKKQC